MGSLSHFPLLPVSLMGSHTDCACPTSGNSKNLRRFARDLAGSFLWVVFCVKLQNCTDAKQTLMPFFYQKSLGLKTEQFCYSSGITGSPSESSLLHCSFVKVNFVQWTPLSRRDLLRILHCVIQLQKLQLPNFNPSLVDCKGENFL